jgi:hypothetical protein
MPQKILSFTRRYPLFSVIIVVVLVLCVWVYIDYWRTNRAFASDLPKVHQRYIQEFKGLEDDVSLGRKNRNYYNCTNESKYGIDIACSGAYTHHFIATDNQLSDTNRVRTIFDALIADGWTGGTKNNLYDVVLAKQGSDLSPTENGYLSISAWKTVSGVLRCDINISYTPIGAYAKDRTAVYAYQLSCRKDMFP